MGGQAEAWDKGRPQEDAVTGLGKRGPRDEIHCHPLGEDGQVHSCAHLFPLVSGCFTL